MTSTRSTATQCVMQQVWALTFLPCHALSVLSEHGSQMRDHLTVSFQSLADLHHFRPRQLGLAQSAMLKR